MLFYIFSVSLSTILDMKDRKKFNGKKPAKRNVERLLDRARWYYSCRLRSSHEEKNRICYDLFWSVSQSLYKLCTKSIVALQLTSRQITFASWQRHSFNAIINNRTLMNARNRLEKIENDYELCNPLVQCNYRKNYHR